MSVPLKTHRDLRNDLDYRMVINLSLAHLLI
jgi:hypothetical protein